MGAFADLTGTKYGLLTVVRLSPKSTPKRKMWECVCKCGGKTTVASGNLKNGHTMSCGCLKLRQNGLSTDRLYDIWRGMIRRCYDSSHIQYSDYGARGITVCDEWRYNFHAFYTWANGNGYADLLTIDRKNNDAGYTPENCTWSTRKEQARNRRTRKDARIDVRRLCERTGLSYSTVWGRLRRGWSQSSILSTVGGDE